MFGVLDVSKLSLNSTEQLTTGSRYEEISSAQPMQAHQWRVYLPDISAPAKGADFVNHSDLDAAYLKASRATREEISDRVASVTLPFVAFSTEKVDDGNSYWNFIKQNELGSIALELYEYNDGKTMLYLQSWIDQMKTSSGTYFPPVVWKREIVAERTTNVDDAVIRHTYYGCFPQNIADITLNYETSDFSKYAVQFTCDGVKTEIISTENTSGGIPEYVSNTKNIPKAKSLTG